LVTALAQTNKQLAQIRVSVSQSLAEASENLDEAENQWQNLHSNHSSIRQLVQIARESGITQDTAIGLALRQEQYSLPPEERLRQDIKERAEQMTIARIDSSKLSDRERGNVDIESRLAEIRKSLPATLETWQKEEAAEECRRLLKEQQTLFTDLTSDYDNLITSLASLISVQKAWLSEIQQFNSLIEEQVLWFRSTDVLHVESIPNEVRSLVGVIATDVKTGLVPYLREDARQRPFTYLLALLLLISLLASRLPLTRRLRVNCPTQAPEGRLSLRPALLSLLFTSILTIPIPATLFFLGWRLAAYSGATPLAEHWSHAFLFSGSGVLVIEFFRQTCRTPGLAVAHLRWPEQNARLVRFHFTWILMVGIPLGILSDLLEGVFIAGVSNRMLFIVSQVVLLLVGHLLLRPRRGLRFNTHEGDLPVQKPLRLQHLYHAIAILIPLVLIAFSAMGYTYTARQIWLRVGDSIQWGLVVLLATMLVLHWLTVLRRRLAMQKVEDRKAKGDSKEQQNEPGPDIWQVYSQSRRMFATLLWIIMAIGLWMIWSDMMPALKKLDRIPVPLLSKTGLKTPGAAAASLPSMAMPVGQQPEKSPAPADEDPTGEVADFLSLGDVIGAAIVLLLTLAASRNLPGFVEMVLLSRVRFQQGEGYAIVTILRYAVLLLGIGWGLTLIGITWNKVQWLAAAVTVGIGFGLQEIFANFVSGLILLFERPVRVGDVITVGTVTGKVTRIQMRATTVRNWDQQELVLPNKDLITGQVINWTLSDDVSRLAITVGVSYDANVKRASELLLAIARANPNVKPDPEPFVAFDEFADSTLNLVLRAYVSIEVRLSTKSQLHTAILERFREEGIEIAYPQRDLHIRSVTTELPPLNPPGGTTEPPAAA
jgi:potassium efflux system protein